MSWVNRVLLDSCLEVLGVDPTSVDLEEGCLSPAPGETTLSDEGRIVVRVRVGLILGDEDPFVNLGNVIAHEAAHVWQIATGLLSFDTYGNVRWKGSICRLLPVEYWEDQANAIEHAIMVLGLDRKAMKVFLPSSEKILVTGGRV